MNQMFMIFIVVANAAWFYVQEASSMQGMTCSALVTGNACALNSDPYQEYHGTLHSLVGYKFFISPVIG